MNRRLARVVVACGVLAFGAAANGAATLEELVRNSDLIVFGLAAKVTKGELDPELKRRGIDFRVDTAHVVVIEVLKGDPALVRKQVRVTFPGFPKKGELTIKPNDKGIWFLRKSDLEGAYAAKTSDRFRPPGDLAAVRRAVRAAAGVVPRPVQPVDKAERARELVKELKAAKQPIDRRNAAFQLGELGRLESAPPLIQALADDERTVRLAADIALRKITGHRIQVDFQSAPVALRVRGQRAWEAWWETNRHFERPELLARAAAASARPQPDLLHAVEGLADYGKPEHVALFLRSYEAALASRNDRLAAAAALYFGRLKDRAYVPKLAALVDGSHAWLSTSTQVTAALAIGRITGEDFGTGKGAVAKAAAWWLRHRDEFR
jgi:hypothetical protein